VPLTADAWTPADLVLILTDHAEVDYAFVLKHARLVLDTRFATAAWPGPAEVVLL